MACPHGADDGANEDAVRVTGAGDRTDHSCDWLYNKPICAHRASEWLVEPEKGPQSSAELEAKAAAKAIAFHQAENGQGHKQVSTTIYLQQQATDLQPQPYSRKFAASGADVKKNEAFPNSATEVSFSSKKKPLCLPASGNIPPTDREAFSSDTASGAASPTFGFPGVTPVGLASTGSSTRSARYSSLLKVIPAVPHASGTSSAENLAKQKLLPSPNYHEKKCVLGSLEDAHSDFSIHAEDNQTGLWQPHERSRCTEHVYRESAEPSHDPSNGAAVTPPASGGIALVKCPELLKGIWCLTARKSSSPIVSLVPQGAQLPPRRSDCNCRIAADNNPLARSGADDRSCLQSEIHKAFSPPRERSLIKVNNSRHMRSTIFCNETAFCSSDCTACVSSTRKTRRRFPRKRGQGQRATRKLLRRKRAVKTASMRTSHRLPSSSCAYGSPPSPDNIACRRAAASPNEGPHWTEDHSPKMSEPTGESIAFGWKKPASVADTTSPKDKTLQHVVRADSKLMTDAQSHHFTSWPQRRPVDFKETTSQHTEVSHQNGRNETSTKRGRDEVSPPRRGELQVTVKSRDLQASFECASEVESQFSGSESPVMPGRRNQEEEYAASILRELQQLQLLLGGGVASEESFPKEHIQRRLQHMQKTAQMLMLYQLSPHPEGEDCLTEQKDLRACSRAVNTALGNDLRSVTYGCLAGIQSSTEKEMETVDHATCAQTAQGLRNVIKDHIAGEESTVVNSQGDFTGEKKHVLKSRRRGPEAGQEPAAAVNFLVAAVCSFENCVEERASLSLTLEKEIGEFYSKVASSNAHLNKLKAETSVVQCGDQVIVQEDRIQGHKAHTGKEGADQCRLGESTGPSANAGGILSEHVCCKESARFDTSCPRDEIDHIAVGEKLVSRVDNMRPDIPQKLSGSTEALATPEGVLGGKRHMYGSAGLNTLCSSVQRTDKAHSECPKCNSSLSDARARQRTPPLKSPSESASSTLSQVGFLRSCASPAGGDGNRHSVCAPSFRPPRVCRKHLQGCVSPPVSTDGFADSRCYCWVGTVSHSGKLQENRPSSNTVICNKTSEGTRSRGMRRSACLHFRRRLRRTCRVRQVSRGVRPSLYPVRNFDSAAKVNSDGDLNEQTIRRNNTLAGCLHKPPGKKVLVSLADQKMSLRPIELSITAPPFKGKGDGDLQPSAQCGPLSALKFSSSDGTSSYQCLAAFQKSLSARDAAEPQPTDRISGAGNASEFISESCHADLTTGEGEPGPLDALQDTRRMQATMQVPPSCRKSTSQIGARLIDAELLQLIVAFIQQQLWIKQREGWADDRKDAGRRLVISPQLDLQKRGDLLPTETNKQAKATMLLASWLGIMAISAEGNAFTHLWKSVVGMPEKKGGAPAAARDTMQATTEAETQLEMQNAFSKQTSATEVPKNTTLSGCWTAKRAATRSARKDHKKQQQLEGGENENARLGKDAEDAADTISPAAQRKSMQKKGAHGHSETGTRGRIARSSNITSQTAVCKTSGIRWELLRTAKRAAHRKEKEARAERQTARMEHHSQSSLHTEHLTRRDEDQESAALSLRQLQVVRQPSKHNSQCEPAMDPQEGKVAGTPHSRNKTVETGGSNGQLHDFPKKSTIQRKELSKNKWDSGEIHLQTGNNASRDCRSPIDESEVSAEDLPSFEDIFNMPDLIPETWYDEAEESTQNGSCLGPSASRSKNSYAGRLAQPGQWVLEEETSTSAEDAPGVEASWQPGFFNMVLKETERVAPSDGFPDNSPAVKRDCFELSTLWDIPDDLVDLVASVPGGSPSALHPPCSLRLLPTSASSSSSSSSPRSSCRSPSTSSPSSSCSSSSTSSSSSSTSSFSNPASTFSSPRAEEQYADKATVSSNNCSPLSDRPFTVSTQLRRFSEDREWGLEASTEHNGQVGDAASVRSECDYIGRLTNKILISPCADHSYLEDERELGAASTAGVSSHASGAGFLQRAFADESVRRTANQSLPHFISLCCRKTSAAPPHRRHTTKRPKVKGIPRKRKSRTQLPQRPPSPERYRTSQKQRRRRCREECLKQRLAAIHRENMSHEEYMGQFARQLRLTAAHKVFCIELTKAERCSLPCPSRAGEGSHDGNGPAHLAASLTHGTLTTMELPFGCPLSERSPSRQHNTFADAERFPTQEKCFPDSGKVIPASPVLTIEGCIAEQLRQRGWVMNRLSSDSHFFDLKWKLSDVDEDYRSLRREQYFNHFQNNRVITTKEGLARSLRRLAVEEQVRVDFFFPRCYHLSSLDECADFLLDYSRCEAVTVLLAYLQCYQANPPELHAVKVGEPLPSNNLRRSAALLLWMAYHIASVWLHELNPDLYLDRTESIEQQGRLDPKRLEVFASHAWQFRSQTQAFLQEWHTIAQREKALNLAVHPDNISTEESAFSAVTRKTLFSWNGKNLSRAPLGFQVMRLLKQLQKWWPLWQLERGTFALENLRASEEASSSNGQDAGGKEEDLLGRDEESVHDEVTALGQKDTEPCWKQHNVWIMKPSSNSKASGIHCLNNPWEILRAGRGLSDRIIQRYVERPLLLPSRRKFDMRQWVLVRSFDPLQVYIFSTLYLRLCSEIYDLRDLQNRFRHVSNRHLNKSNNDTQPSCSGFTTKDICTYAPACVTAHGVPEEVHGLDSCQPLAELEAMLAKRTGNPHFFQENVMPQIRNIVLQTVRAARPSVIPRPNSFELYGFDILLDEAYRAWLIEVNLSPACAANADWQQQMVKRMTGDMLDLLFRDNPTCAYNGEEAHVSDAGHWALVFDESVDPRDAVRVFPPVEPADKSLAAGYPQKPGNPYLEFYFQPVHKRRGSPLEPRALGGAAKVYPTHMRAEEKAKGSQAVGPAAASWDKLVVAGEHLPRQAEAAVDAWCRFTEAKNRIISWWRRTAWRRRAARRRKLSLCEDVEIDYYFSLL